jgi:hypothetical protein
MRRHFLIPLALLAAAAGCSSDVLAPATVTNAERSVTLGSLVGTPLSVPSAFSVADNEAVRTDQTSGFDFAFNIDAAGRPVLLPRALLGISSGGAAEPGLLATSQKFDDITTAESNGYITADTVPIAIGNVFFARSRLVCASLGVPEYAKLEITAFGDHTVTFRVIADNNCGYRSLVPGLPGN